MNRASTAPFGTAPAGLQFVRETRPQRPSQGWRRSGFAAALGGFDPARIGGAAACGVDPAARAEYDAWVDHNVQFLRDLFGDRLVSVIEHVDEDHPHLHAYILPLDDLACSARDLNPAWVAKAEAEAAAWAAGEDDKAAVKLGNIAYRARARALQDQYHRDVGLASGLTRTGPKRQRLSRAQWRTMKEEALRAAQTLRHMERMAGDLVDREEGLTASAEKLARDLAAKLDQAEAIFADADAGKNLAAELAAAREDGQRAIVALHEELAAQQGEIERRIEVAGAELSGVVGERDQFRAELEQFVALRDLLGIQLVEARSRITIVVPEGQEIRAWRAPGLHELARYNGRMFRVMARE